MSNASPIKYSFNAGELSPLMQGRVDQAKYNSGCEILRNFIPTVQGPTFRRGGTYFVAPVKNPNDRTWLWRFQFNVSQAYILEFGDFYVRFYNNHAQVLSGSAAYEISSPYAVADLTDADGAFALTLEQSNDIIYIAHSFGTYPFYKLERFSNTNWQFVQVQLMNGPFQPANTNQGLTVYATSGSGTINVAASAPLFNANMVGSLFYIEEQDSGIYPPWEPGVAISTGNRRRSDGKTYIAQNTGTTGTQKPVHTYGQTPDGAAGITWLYSDPGYGWVLITSLINSQLVNATVISQLPSAAVSSSGATFRWALSTFSADAGYPECVAIFRERLVLTKGVSLVFSQSADYENFLSKEYSQVTAECSIQISLQGTQQNKIKWMKAANDLLLGTAGDEHIATEISSSEPLSPTNIRTKLQTEYGSRGVKPLLVGEVLLFMQRSGRKLRSYTYDFGTNNYKGSDLTVLSEHLTAGGIVDMDYQQEPYSVVWCVTGKGKLIGFTYNEEQNVLSWHPHPIGGNGFVESVRCIPAPDNTRDELWLIVRRTINGTSKRYVERMQPELDTTTMRQQDGFYVDCGLSVYNTINTAMTPGAGATVQGTANVQFTVGAPLFNNGDLGRSLHYDYSTLEFINDDFVSVPQKAIAFITQILDNQNVLTTIRKPFPNTNTIAANAWRKTITGVSGFSHLEGMTVDISVDGAPHPQMVVSGGAVTPLQYQGSVVHVGLPAPCKAKGMRIEAGSQTGSAQGKIKRTNRLTMRFKDTVGGRVAARDELYNALEFRTAETPLNEVPALFSGDHPVTMPEGYDTDGYIIYENKQPLPVTLICWIPEMQSQDRG